MKRSLFLVALAMSSLSFGTITFLEGETAYDHIDQFLGIEGTYAKEFSGMTEEDQPCQFRIKKSETEIVFTPTRDGHFGKSFVIPKIEQYDVRGGFEGDELWAGYFIDKPSSPNFPAPHGQFGMGYDIKMTRNTSGKLIRFYLQIAEQMDLNFKILERLECVLKN